MGSPWALHRRISTGGRNTAPVWIGIRLYWNSTSCKWGDAGSGRGRLTAGIVRGTRSLGVAGAATSRAVWAGVWAGVGSTTGTWAVVGQ